MDFVMQIEPRGDRWYLSVVDSPAGQARGETRPPFHGIATVSDEKIEGTGSLLFEALFPPPIAELWRRSLDLADQRQKPLRLQLRPATELAVWPWELLRDPRGDFLALSARTPIVRYVELPEPESDTLISALPLRLLIMTASPLTMPPLSGTDEAQAIKAALGPLIADGALVVELIDRTTPAELQETLRRVKPHAVHLIAHGSADGTLWLETDEGLEEPMDATSLKRLLTDIPTLRFAWLNSCHGASPRAARANPALALVQAGLPAVLAMQREVPDGAAAQLAAELYQGLTAGLRLEVALAEARKSLARADAERLEMGYAPGHAMTWSIPALFLRTSDSRLWSWSHRTTPTNGHPTAEPAHPPAAGGAPTSTAAPPAHLQRRVTKDGRTVVPVAGGQVWVGPPGAETLVTLNSFWLDETPVSNTDYQRFMIEKGASPPPSWPNGRIPDGEHDHPVTAISWREATRYAAWAGKRLPTAHEWEAAARGGDGRQWPWGRTWATERANTSERGLGTTAPVSAHPQGAAPCGALDLAGNVWEWVSDEHPEGGRMMKGGSFLDGREAASAWESAGADPDKGFEDVGFRCATDSL